MAIALLASAALVLAAPFVGVARSQLQAVFPGRFSLIVYTLILISAMVPILMGLRRISARQRVGGLAQLACAAGVAAIYVWWTGSRDNSIRAVEMFHFIEYGAITFFFFRVWRHFEDGSTLALPAIAAFIVGVAEEAFQWFLPARVGELKDVALNGVAIGCGLIASLALAPLPRVFRWSAAAMRRTGRMLALAVVALAAFVHLVHLGTIVRDAHVSFESRNTADQLAEADVDRRAQWRTNPPLVRPDRLSREDQFTTEGLQHVQARNLAWTSGDAVTAWHENAILERHFGAVLDTPSYVAKEGHRWPAALRAEAEAKAGESRSAPFMSTAFPYPIFTWSPVELWGGALTLAFALWSAGVGS